MDAHSTPNTPPTSLLPILSAVLNTAKLKLLPTPEQGEALRQTQLAYRDGLNAVSRYAFEQGKTSNAKITKKRFKGLDQPPHYSSLTVQYTYERDYTFKLNQQVSIGTLNGRITIPYQGKDSHIRRGASIGDAKLWYEQPKKCFYVLVSLEIDVPEPTCEHLSEVVGVDVGIRYLARGIW